MDKIKLTDNELEYLSAESNLTPFSNLVKCVTDIVTARLEGIDTPKTNGAVYNAFTTPDRFTELELLAKEYTAAQQEPIDVFRAARILTKVSQLTSIERKLFDLMLKVLSL